MPRQPHTVFDGLESTVEGAKAKVADVGARVRDSRAVAVVAALFGTTPSRGGRETGPVNYRTVDQRVAETRGDVRRYRRASTAAGPELDPTSGWPGAMGVWVSRVKPGGIWDDRGRAEAAAKAAAKVGREGVDWRQFERQGNFSYGATAAGLGLPLPVAQFGAGAMQRISNVGKALRGEDLKPSVGYLGPYYGDDPRDQAPIREGYAYGRRLIKR